MGERFLKFHSGGYYHVFNRGANREEIFRTSENYFYLIELVERFVVNGIQMIVYCLMPNHFHFLLRQTADYSVSQFIQAVFNIYSKAFNKAHHRKGTVFEGSFRAIEIYDQNHLLHLCRYIHRNPLEAGLAADLNDWPYSNYTEWANFTLPRTSEVRGSVPAMSGLDFFREHFSNAEEYRKFVADYHSPKKLENGFEELLLD